MRNGDDNIMDVKNGRVTPASNSKSLNNEWNGSFEIPYYEGDDVSFILFTTPFIKLIHRNLLYFIHHLLL